MPVGPGLNSVPAAAPKAVGVVVSQCRARIEGGGGADGGRVRERTRRVVGAVVAVGAGRQEGCRERRVGVFRHLYQEGKRHLLTAAADPAAGYRDRGLAAGDDAGGQAQREASAAQVAGQGVEHRGDLGAPRR